MKLLTIITLLLTSSLSYSQVSAVTEKGDTVLLFNDGTWEFANEYSGEEQDSEFKIDTNYTPFIKGSDAKKTLKGQKVSYSLWYDASKWNLDKSGNSSVEYSLTNKMREAFCLIIPERITTSMEGLLNIAVTNAEGAGKNVEIIDYEIRNVNNSNVAMLKMSAVIDDIKFIYLGYYYAGEDKTIQVITYTFDKFADEYLPEMEKLLNGLVTTPD